MENMEIERKWLIRPDRIPFSLEGCKHHEIEQFYISSSPTIRARSIDGSQFILTVKTKPDDPAMRELSRNEYEMPLSRREYDSLREIARGRTIRKTRYCRPEGEALTAEIDIFRGEFNGLAYLEIEFPDVQSAVNYPGIPWAVREVTNEKEFKNGHLAFYGMPRIDI